MASARSSAAQLGSRHRTGISRSSHGRSESRERRNIFCALSIWPVDIHVSPQHTLAVGTSTAKPAEMRTVTASSPICGSK